MFCILFYHSSPNTMSNSNYVVAIPSYNRVQEIIHKTLKTLNDGGVPSSKIYIFVANPSQRKLYEENVPRSLYNEIVVGKKGIANQRVFISRYFPIGQYVVSMDDDVEKLEKLRGDKLTKIHNLDDFFRKAYDFLKKEELYIWGIYPVHNPFFMHNKNTTDLKFIIGVLHGYIARHLKSLEPSVHAESKEDYEMSIKYFLQDGGVVRFNNVCAKTKFNSPGGLGTDRAEMNKNAALYLKKTYPELVTPFQRPTNGMTEIQLSKVKRFYPK